MSTSPGIAGFPELQLRSGWLFGAFPGAHVFHLPSSSRGNRRTRRLTLNSKLTVKS
jgi:hypothetical protein